MAQQVTLKSMLQPVIAVVLLLGVWSGASGCQASKNSEVYTELPPQRYHQLLAEKQDPYIIDVRTAVEHQRGHIRHARNISYLSFSFKKRAARLDTARPAFIYCHTAHRSPFAARILHRLGFREIYDLQGGFKQWTEAGLPVSAE